MIEAKLRSVPELQAGLSRPSPAEIQPASTPAVSEYFDQGRLIHHSVVIVPARCGDSRTSDLHRYLFLQPSPAPAPSPLPSQAAPPLPPPPTSASSDVQEGAAPPPPPAPPAPPAEDTSGMIPISQHPDYATFFKMLRVGVPDPVVRGKMGMLGLDPSILDTPDKFVPAPQEQE